MQNEAKKVYIDQITSLMMKIAIIGELQENMSESLKDVSKSSLKILEKLSEILK